MARHRPRGGAGKAGLGPELEPRASLTVEHILPKNPGNAWKPILSKDSTFADEYTYRLGNLCLLTLVNRRIGNAGFADKQKVYAKSDLLLTSELATITTAWTANEVEKRQKRLATLAVAAWRFD